MNRGFRFIATLLMAVSVWGVADAMPPVADVAPRGVARREPGVIRRDFPTTGSVRGLIILAEYQDVRMSDISSPELFDRMLNEENLSEGELIGSVRDYFIAQSDGRFIPEFDVVGPVLLPRERSYYGTNDDIESYVAQMRDACTVADRDHGVDFGRYDANEDGVVDFVFIIYAGHGEAQGGGVETVWPAMLDYSKYMDDEFDGLTLGTGACSSELKGRPTDPPAVDGIGTICHEFSHILGLPDIYDTQYKSGYGMGHYDLMDRGEYNGGAFVPAGYTAFERYYVGWLTPRIITEETPDITLEPLSEGGEAIFLVNPGNKDEYYTLENRQWIGWDAGLPGHGLLISRITYDPGLWASNIVNTPGRSHMYEHVKIMAADNVWILNIRDDMHGGNEGSDTFPGTKGKTEFSGRTVPRALWMSTQDATECGFSVENIREYEDGRVAFDIRFTDTGVERSISQDGGLEYRAGVKMLISDGECRIFNLRGEPVAESAGGEISLAYLPGGIYIAVGGNGERLKIVI